MPVNTPHALYMKYKPQWKRLRHAIMGQDAVHAAKREYLPELSGQTDEEYKAYVKRALFYGATGRTLDGLSGMVFRKKPNTELTPAVEEFENNITLDGLSLLGFAEQIVDDVVAVGRCGILVDHPSTEGIESLTRAQAEQLNMRPFFKHYSAESIINWRTSGVRNSQVLIEVRLMETVEEPGEKEFDYEEVEQIRVLDLDDFGDYRQRIYRKAENRQASEEEWVQFGEDVYPQLNGANMDFIPFVFIGVKNTSAHIDKPPLIDMADVNFSHYRSTADLEHGAHFTALPTAVISGLTEADDEGNAPEYRIGSATAWVFSSPETKAEYLEYQGQGLTSLENRIRDKEQQMAALGARMLTPEKRAAEAAETAQIHRSGENSVLASLAQSVSDGLEMALKYFNMWATGEEGDNQYKLNKDFLAVLMSPQQLTALMGAWQSGAIAFDDLLYNLKRGEIVEESRGADEIRSEVQTENPFPNDDGLDDFDEEDEGDV